MIVLQGKEAGWTPSSPTAEKWILSPFLDYVSFTQVLGQRGASMEMH